MSESREKIGATLYKLNQKEPDSHDVQDYSEAMKEDLASEIESLIKNASKQIDGDFFIELLQRDYSKLKGGHNMFGHFPAARRSCPTPFYDQSAFHYHRDSGDLEHLWTLPCRKACLYLIHNKNKLSRGDRNLLEYVMDYYSGNLLLKAKKLNNEPLD